MNAFYSLLSEHARVSTAEPAVGGSVGRRAAGAAYTASLGQGVPTVSGERPLAGLLQLMVAGVLYDGFKSCLEINDIRVRGKKGPWKTL